MKYYALISVFFPLLLVVTGCSKIVSNQDLVFRKMPVINCIFDQERTWEVNISFSGNDSNYFGSPVNDAIVRILSGGQLIDQLQYRDSGNYISSTFLKPQVNIEYQLEVTIPNYPVITASDKIPAPIILNSVQIDTTSFYYSYNPFYGPVKVFEVNAKFTDNDFFQKYYVCRPLYYKKEELQIYKVTVATIDSLKKINRYRAFDSINLNKIINIEFCGKTNFQKKLIELYKSDPISGFIYDFSKSIFCNSFLSELYMPHAAYVSDLKFKQIENFGTIFFGEKESGSLLQNYPLRILYNYFPGGGYSIVNGDTVKIEAEFYLQINSISYAGYKYFTTYSQNIVNRGNPFTEQINVFSNVKNGTGIFAGRNSRLYKIW